jgi:pyruvate dehydrogenase E2 component (dihydrolipoamide acetyltransferase)
MADIVMPRLSDTMEEGTILRWLIADGAPVRRGQELVEIETDKATMTYESDLDGVLRIVAAEGDTLAVGALIARVGEPAAEAGSAGEQAGLQATTPATPAAPAAESLREAITAPAREAAPTQSGAARVRASPLARRIARDTGVELHALTGTGPGGRIVKADVEAAARGTDPGATSPTDARLPTAREVAVAPGASRGDAGATARLAAGVTGVTTAKGETTEIELTRTQQTIARRMAESKATIPHFVLQADIDMDACVALRSELKRLTPGSPPAETIPTYNDMIVKASALALREHPRANSSYRDGRLQLHGRVNVGVAVAVAADSAAPAGGALIVPTVFDADTKSLGEIARETRALAARVREHSITPPELGGGTFTVSNLGMFGVSAFTAIINPPQAAILSVGSVQARPVVDEDGEIAARQTMTVTLACDHRILYGADAARFLTRVRELLETPTALAL